ncbi:hypothetical protein [Thermomonospora umbrina]|uniref:ATP synthase protein I n=1 Tax=Thermomonospora umbrina TaxID=111806 RepID=A0A3D9SX13_9ACTN|nr:hypothetical protein [Thermomonospora umbrina]REE98583.1 ATP synthase protein I [Thermomonospora umbrina]
MHSSDARILRGAAIPTALAGAAAIVVGLLVAGGGGALGAAFGTLVAIAFFTVSVVAVSHASKISPQMMFAAAVFSYITKVFAMFGLIAVFQNTTAWDSQVFGYTIIALTLVWIVAEIRVATRSKTPYIDDPAESTGSTGTGGGLAASTGRTDTGAPSGSAADRSP